MHVSVSICAIKNVKSPCFRICVSADIVGMETRHSKATKVYTIMAIVSIGSCFMEKTDTQQSSFSIIQEYYVKMFFKGLIFFSYFYKKQITLCRCFIKPKTRLLL